MDAKEKSKKVLFGMISGAGKALVKTVYDSWRECYKRSKREAEIRKEYAAEIDVAQQRLTDYTAQQLKSVKAILMRGKEAKEGELHGKIWNELKEHVEERKRDIAAQAEVEQLEAQLKSMAENSSGNAKKVLARMNAGRESGLVENVFKAWVQFCVDYKKNKDLEEAVRAAESKVADFQAKQKSGTASVLNKMSAGADSALLTQTYKAWVEWYSELKRANELEEMMNGANSKFSAFTGRNKASAKSATQRAADAIEEGDKVFVFQHWKREARIDRMRRYGKEKNAKRKQQLVGVKGLFKNFASELEQGLRQGTPRLETAKKQAIEAGDAA